MSYKGFQKTVINWDEVEKLASYQCTQEECAAFYMVSVDTLDNYCKRDLGLSLSEFWSKKRAVGRIKLRKAQMMLVEKGGPGAATMAIYLDKKLFPTERPDLPTPPETPQNQKTDSKLFTFEQFCINAGYPEPFDKQVEAYDFCMTEGEPRLLLGARGYGKTDYITILGVAYKVYIDYMENPEKPSYSVLIITKSKSRNTAIIEEIAKALGANGVELDKENASLVRVKGLIGKDHSIEAITIKTSMRGRHPKMTVLDDPVTEEDVSEAMRKLVKRKYNEILKLCSNVVVIGQPAHKFDLYAELRPLVKRLELPFGSIPELDHDLEAQRLAGVDEASIQASYYLQIVNEGTIPFAGVKWLDKFPAGDGAVAFIDPSHEGGDYTALSILKGYFDGIAVKGKVWKMAWNHCLDDMTKVLISSGVRKVAFETNALGDQPIIMLRQALSAAGIGVIGLRSNTNKHSRIMAAGAYAHLIHLSKDSDKIYTEQVTQYEYKAKHDDAPDSLASCMRWVGLIRGKE